MTQGSVDIQNSSKVERLASCGTVGQILSMVIGFERTAQEFYVGLAEGSQGALRDLAFDLAEEEKRHVMLFEVASARWDVHSHVSESIDMPSDTRQYNEMANVPSVENFESEESVLQYAILREEAAMNVYGALAERPVPRPLKEVFVFLAAEERQHMEDLQSRLQAIQESGD